MEPEKPKDLLDWLGVSNTPNWRVARSLGSFLAVALTLLFILALVAAFAVVFHTIGTATSGAEEGINLGAGALVAALLGAPFVIWGTFLKYQTVRYQKEGHITDRINKAVEQLGAEKTVDRIGRPVKIAPEHSYGRMDLQPDDQILRNEIEWQGEVLPLNDGEDIAFSSEWRVFSETVPNIEVRIGAILSLERIAQDSTRYDNGRDHVRVMEILCAYVRGNAPVNSTKPEEHETEEGKPRIDIQTLFDVLKRRSNEQIAIEAKQKYRLNFEGTDLRGVDLANGKFAGAIFYRSNLQFANLNNADFSGARLQGCSVNFVDWFRCDLTGANLDFSILNKPDPNHHNVATNLFLAQSTKALSLVGADMSSLKPIPQKRGFTFGSSETRLNDHFDFARRTANERSELCDDELSEFDSRNRGSSWQAFQFWSPYQARNGATSGKLQELLTHYGISGWPFED